MMQYEAYMQDQERGIKDSTNHYAYEYKDPSQDSYDYSNRYEYDRGSKENGYNNQNQKRAPSNSEKKGFYNFSKGYQAEAIIEAPDEGDY